jgi:uncharacterized membrane protein YhaH (DUF805 family)
MNFTTAIRTCFSRYVTFSGRAPRSEYWWFVLFCILGSIAAAIVDAIIFGFARGPNGGFDPVGTIFSLATFLPSLSVGVRRLHDLGRSGWWWWLWLIPVIGWIILIWWAATKGEEAVNAYGPDPLGGGTYGASPIPRVPRQ